MIRLNNSGYLVTRCRGAMRKERRFIRRNAVLSFWETSRKILKAIRKKNIDKEAKQTTNSFLQYFWLFLSSFQVNPESAVFNILAMF